MALSFDFEAADVVGRVRMDEERPDTYRFHSYRTGTVRVPTSGLRLEVRPEIDRHTSAVMLHCIAPTDEGVNDFKHAILAAGDEAKLRRYFEANDLVYPGLTTTT